MEADEKIRLENWISAWENEAGKPDSSDLHEPMNVEMRKIATAVLDDLSKTTSFYDAERLNKKANDELATAKERCREAIDSVSESSRGLNRL